MAKPATDKATDEGPNTERRLRELVEEVIAGTPHYVVDVVLRGRKGSQVVDVFVDSDEELSVDALAEVSREVEFLLDTEDLIAGRYQLNVSSPGLDRPLAMPRQYRKNVGRELRVHYRKEDGSGNAEVVGKLAAADEAGIEIAASGETHRIAYDDVIWAKVQLPW